MSRLPTEVEIVHADITWGWVSETRSPEETQNLASNNKKTLGLLIFGLAGVDRLQVFLDIDPLCDLVY